MGIHNNTPNFGYISIKGLTIQKGEKFYTVNDVKTPMEHLYWESDNPSVLRPSDMNLGTSGTRYLLYRNNSGEVIEVPNDELIITYNDSTSNPIFEEKVISLTEKVDDDNKKIVQLELDSNGFKQTVGDWKVSSDGTIKESITKIVQTNKDIDLKVNNTTKEFNENKAVEELKQKFIKAVLDFNSELGISDSLLYTYYKDKVITDEEDKNIQSLLSLMDAKKSEVVLQTNEFIKLAELQNQTTQKDAMITERDKFSDTVATMVNYIKTAISDKIVTTMDISGIINTMSKCSTDITTLKNTVNSFLFLGSGGKIVDEMARISIKSNEIILQVSNNEELIKTTLGVEKNLLQSQVVDYRNACDDLKYKIGICYPDGISDADEIKSINNAADKIGIERQDIVDKYNELYNNKYLTSNGKTQIKTSYDLFINKSNEMISKIKKYFADGFINDVEVNDSYTLINDATSYLLDLSTQLSYAIDEIDDETKKAELQAVKDEMKKEVDDVSSDLNKLNGYVDGTFKNNVIDESEKKMLSESLKAFKSEKIDIDNTYNQLHSSKFLDGLKKTQFEQQYASLNTKYNNLTSVYDAIINKTSLIANSDRTNLSNAENAFNNELGKFKGIANSVIEYINDKQASQLKTDLDTQVKNLDSKVDGMQSDIENTITDNLIDGSEKITLNSNLELLYNEYGRSEVEYIKLRDNEDLEDAFKQPMRNAFNDAALHFGMLVSYIDSLVNKSTEITELEKTELKDYFANYRKYKDIYSKKAYEAIDAIKNKSIKDMQTSLNKEIDDVTKSVTDLENNMNTVFKDGVLSDSEKLTLKQNLQNLQKDKMDVDNGYNSLYPNADLLDPAKSNLKNAYGDYISKYNELCKQTNNIINKIGIIDGADKTAFETAYNNFKTTSGIYVKRVNESLESIAKRKKDLAENNSKTYTDAKVKVLTDEIDLKVSQTTYDENNVQLTKKFSDVNLTINGIKNTVQNVQNDYTLKSIFEQTVDDFEFKFERSGSENIIRNAWFRGGSTHWNFTHWNNGDASPERSDVGVTYGNVNDGWLPLGRPVMRVINYGGNNQENNHWHGINQYISVEPSTAYTFSCYLAQHRTKGFMIEIKYDTGNGITSKFVEPKDISNSISVMPSFENNFTLVSFTFLVPRDCTGIQLLLWSCGRTSENASYMWIAMPQLERGVLATSRRVNSNEIYSDRTKIDQEGVIVYHDGGDYTRMSSQGLKRHRSNGDAKGDYHYLTQYIGFTTTASTTDLNWIQLKDDFKGKNFTAYSVISDTWEDSWNYGEPWVIQRFVTFVETSQIDYANARVPIRGYRIDKNYNNGERRTRPIAGVLLVIA